MAAFCGVIVAQLLSHGYGIPISVGLTLLAGVLVGSINAAGVGKLGNPASVVTLAGLQVYRGFALLVSGGMTVGGLPPQIKDFSRGTLLGIPVFRMTLIAYVLSSGLATLAGILLVLRLSIASPSMANAYELQAIAAAVVGGASLFGGRGTVLGAVAGAILFTTMGNGAVLLNIDPFWEMVLEGLLIALVVYLDNLQKKRQSGL